MTPQQYKNRINSLLKKLEQDLPLARRKLIIEEIKGMIEALIPDE